MKISTRVLLLVLSVLMLALLLPLGAFAANKPPTEIVSYGSNFGYDFKLTFSDTGWLAAINGVSVNGSAYVKQEYSSSVWNDTDYYVDASRGYILIGEGYAGNNPATCVISADGYDDLTLKLDKTNHKAEIVESTTECVHSGGTATCKKRAVCEKCGQEYGELGDHHYVDGICEYCGATKALKEAPTVSVAKTTYLGSDYYTLSFEDAADYVSGISEVQVNGVTSEAASSPFGVTGLKYYADKEKNQLSFATVAWSSSETILKSGDTITLKNSDYQDAVLKITIAGDTVKIEPDDGSSEDPYVLHVRLVGTFEAAVVNQQKYDAVSSASTNVTSNKSSDVEVQAALLEKDKQPAETDWKALKDTTIQVNNNEENTYVTIEPTGSGMVGIYNTYDSSLTLAGTPQKAGSYQISVTVTDDQGRTTTSNALPFNVYDPATTTLADRLKTENFTQTQDGKYLWDMEPWTISTFGSTNETVTVPSDLKAWYGSHTSGTYGVLGYAVSETAEPTQTLILSAGCNLTLVNMDIKSSVKIIVQDGAKLVLRDSVVNGVVEVQNGGTFSMNYDDYSGKFLTGASINGQVVLKDGAVLENAMIYSNANFIANGTEARHVTKPVVAVEGNVTVKVQVFIRGDEAATGTDATTGKSYAGQAGLSVKNGTLTLADDAVLAVYGGGHLATTTNGGNAIQLENGTITGNGKLIAIGGGGEFGTGGNAVSGAGTISTREAYLEGGSTFKPAQNEAPGKALTENITLSGNTAATVKNGIAYQTEAENPHTLYWSDITEIPDASQYETPGQAPSPAPAKPTATPTASTVTTAASTTTSAAAATPKPAVAPTATPTTTVPQTGDTFPYAALVALMCAAAGFGVALYRKKKQ